MVTTDVKESSTARSEWDWRDTRAKGQQDWEAKGPTLPRNTPINREVRVFFKIAGGKVVVVTGLPGSTTIIREPQGQDYGFAVKAHPRTIEDYTIPLEPDDLADAAAEPDERIVQKFTSLVDRWKRDTQFASTILEAAMHPAYQQIIGMGPLAVRLILSRLAAEPEHWFWALKAITGEDPVPKTAKGNLTLMTGAWLDWGKRHGYDV